MKNNKIEKIVFAQKSVQKDGKDFQHRAFNLDQNPNMCTGIHFKKSKTSGKLVNPKKKKNDRMYRRSVFANF